MEYLHTPIQTEADAEGFFFCLDQDGKLFHPEDDPATVVNASGRVFTDEQAELLRERITEVYEVMAEPCAYILGLLDQNIATDDTRSHGPHHPPSAE